MIMMTKQSVLQYEKLFTGPKINFVMFKQFVI